MRFLKLPWQAVTPAHLGQPVGVGFYDGDHSAEETEAFMRRFTHLAAGEAVLVLDDWDRVSVREGAHRAEDADPRWRLLHEMAEYTDGLTTALHHFGYGFGVSVWGFRR